MMLLSVTVKAGEFEHLAVDLHSAGFDPTLGVAARAEARARQPLGNPFGFAHLAAAAPRKARKSFASPSEIRNSGCHCTPMQKR